LQSVTSKEFKKAIELWRRDCGLGDPSRSFYDLGTEARKSEKDEISFEHAREKELCYMLCNSFIVEDGSVRKQNRSGEEGRENCSGAR
jgi:hypothetical protein